jgi:hypothetical protein
MGRVRWATAVAVTRTKIEGRRRKKTKNIIAWMDGVNE